MSNIRICLSGASNETERLAKIAKQANAVNDELRKLRLMVEELPPVSVQLCESKNETPSSD